MTKKPININPDYFTLTNTQIIIAKKETGTPFSTATDFFYEKDEKIYLITNWHNVSGRNLLNGECLSNHVGVPNMFVYLP